MNQIEAQNWIDILIQNKIVVHPKLADKLYQLAGRKLNVNEPTVLTSVHRSVHDERTAAINRLFYGTTKPDAYPYGESITATLRKRHPDDIANELTGYYDRITKTYAESAYGEYKLVRKDEKHPTHLDSYHSIAYSFSQYGKPELREDKAGQFRIGSQN